MLKASFLKELARIVGEENILTSRRDLLAYSYDATQHQEMPEAVLFPRSAREVSLLMKSFSREKVPVVPRGAGTGISGGTIPIRGGVVLALSRMDRILALDTANHRAVVEPGVVNLDLQNALAPLGFIYPPDPASQKSCTLGGNIGENAGGPLCFRYGVTLKYVCGLEIVLPDGEIVQLGGQVEDVPGYDLRGLLIGSEGILGVVTKLILQIVPAPETSKTMLAIFDSLEDSGKAVADIIQAGITPAALEIMDKTMCWAIEQSLKAGYPVDAEGVLLIEVAGLNETMDRQVNDISAICRRNHARELRQAKSAVERDTLWKGRKGAFGSVARICPPYLVNDGTVPRGSLVPALRRVGEISAKYRVRIANVAHAGDGNLHPLIVFNSENAEETNAALKAGEEILRACVSLGGTISGEHGIGLQKLAAMHEIFGPADLAAMRKVKQVFDPSGLLNPGKKIPGQNGPRPAENESRVGLLENLEREESVLVSHRIGDLKPQAVAFPTGTAEVARALRAAQASGATIVTWGSGSKQQQGPPPASAATVLSLKKMNRTLDLDPSNCTVRVEAGKVNSELQKDLAPHNLFFPLDPPCADSSTIGGELATNASGPLRLMYGIARDLVLGLTAVTAEGDVLHPGGKTIKNVAGLDLCRLLIGSWGTLGVITEAVLRLYPLPEVRKSLGLVFPSSGEALAFCEFLAASVLTPAAIELLDRPAANRLDNGPWRSLQEGEVLLLVRLEGSEESVARHITQIEKKAGGLRAPDGAVLTGEEETGLWRNYAGLRSALLGNDPLHFQGKAGLPLAQLGAMISESAQILKPSGAGLGLTAHCGNGILNIYARAPKEQAVGLVAALRQATGRLGGFFALENGSPSLRQDPAVWANQEGQNLVNGLKKAFDPHNILNPGRIGASR